MKNKYAFSIATLLLLLSSGAKSQCIDQTVTPVSGTVICAGSSTITLASSEPGVNYYVNNDATSVTVTGPVAGTGGSLVLGTGHMTTSTIYNVVAAKATGALTFDGIDDYVAIGTPVNSNSNFSWEVWIKTNADGTIFSKTAASGNWAMGGKSLYIRNGKITFEVFGAGYTETYNAYADNSWHHVTVTAEMGYLGGANDRVRIYVDGVMQVERNNWDIQINAETGLVNKLGYTNSNFPATSAYSGIMDDFKFWTSVRTSTDIASDMTSCLTGTETTLSAYYTFENATGTTLTDMAGGDNTGTLTSMPANPWVFGRDDCGSCRMQLTQKPVYVVTAIADQTLTAQTLTLCSTGTTNINTSGSELGVNYYLRDNSNYNVLSGPYAGTGGSLALGTGFVINTSTYNVVAYKISGALSFDGVDDYVTCNESGVLENLGTAPFTMESWIYPNTTSGIRSIIRKDGDYNLYLNNGFPVAETFTAGGIGGALTQAASTASVQTGKWSHVAAVWNGTSFSLYINGIPAGASVSNLSSTVTSKFCIGGSKPFGQTFDGRIDEVRLWNAARSVNQITAGIGSCLTGTETALIGYYTFENGRGSSMLSDLTTYSNNAVLANMDNVLAWRGGIDNCSCSLMMSNTPVINTNTTPTVAVNSGSVCSGTPFTITPSGAGVSSFAVTGGNFTVTPSATTQYSVTGTNTAGCTSAPAIATVSVSASPTINVNNFNICSGNSLVIAPTGADSYTITGNTFTVTPASTTAYTITGTSTVGCAATNTAVSTVSVNATPTISVNSASICSGSSLVITPTGAGTYTISGGTFTVSPATGVSSYSVTGTATNGCMSATTAVATVTVYSTPTISVNSATVCSGASVVITPTGATNYSITGNTFTVSPSSTTSYTVTGTSTTGCISSNAPVATVSISPTPTVAVNSGSICSGGSFTIQPSGANSYTVTGGNFTVSPSATTSYTVMGSNGSCVSPTAAIATVTVNLTPTITVNSATICSGSSVAIVPTGAASYTVTGNAFTVSPSSTTSYTITGTGTNVCTPNQAVSTISVNTTPTVTINSGSLCAGSSFTLVPNGASTYTVSGNTLTVTPAITTTYSVSGSSTAGCISNMAMATLTVNPVPFITVANGSVCSGGTFTLNPSGAATYTYSGGTNVVAPTVNTSYTITGTSAQGCAASNTAIATVSIVNSLAVSVSGNTTICSGQSATLSASGASTYSWTPSTVAGTITVSPNTTSTYTVTGASGSCSNTAYITVSVSPIPTIGVNSGSICAGGVFTIAPTGAGSYTISGGSATVSPLATTAYSVTGSSGPGCVSSNTAISTVAVAPLPVINASTSRPVICIGETAVLAASGATNYVWSDAQTGASITISPLANTTYTVIGFSAAGCVNTSTVMQMTDACTGIKQNTALIFGVYPNPNNGQFVIDTEENVSIEIVNTLGETVYHEANSNGTARVSIAHLSNGIYFVKANGGGRQHIVRIVKE